MWNKLSIANKLWLMAAVSATLLLSSAVTGYVALKTVGSAAKMMGQGKDVVADILPPPMYLVEAQLAAITIVKTNGADLDKQLDRLNQLQNDYNYRTAFWNKSSDISDEVKNKLLGAQKTAADQWWAEATGKFIPAAKNRDFETANLSLTTLSNLYNDHRNGVDDTVKVASEFAAVTMDGLGHEASRAQTILVGMSVFGAIVSLLVASLIIVQIRSNLAEAALVAKSIASGDLSKPISITTQDEIGQLMSSMAEMSQGLSNLVGDIRSGVLQLKQHSLELSNAASNGAAIAEGQSDAASSMAASIEELSVSLDQVEENASDARNKALESANTANTSAAVIEDSALEMRKISEVVQDSAGSIRNLEVISGEISNIVNVIHEVADQTNLLALNAAIEAARAGEYGRGFAVVADEVRKLAERTSSSSDEITQMIQKIQSAAQQSVAAMENGVARVGHGVELSIEAGKTVLHIKETQAQVTANVDEINFALKEQASAMREIARKVESVSQGTEELAATVRQTSGSADELARQAEILSDLTARFRLS